MKPFLTRWFATAVAVAAATWVTGIRADHVLDLLIAALVLGIINASVRPVLLFLSLPFIVVSLGLFILVVNGLLLWLVGMVVPGFHVDGFGQAFFGALVVSLVNWVLSAFLRTSDGSYRAVGAEIQEPKPVRGRVISSD